MNKLIEKLLPLDELIETVKRFPLSVLCALFMFTLSIMLVHDVIDEKDEWLGRIFAIAGCCYFWFGISKLISESQNWKQTKHLLVSGVVAVGIFTLFWFSDLWFMHLVFVLPALLLGLMFAPYLTSGDDISVWFFNRTMWFGVIVSYAALMLFAGGLSLALAAIHTLFDVEIDHELYSDIWLFAALVLGPLYALSWVPKRFEFSEDDCYDPPGLRFIANWISAPMVFIYLLILYAYFIKIVLTGEVPNGHLAFLITGFAGAGIVTYMIAWPMRDSGSFQLRLFYKIFFPALIIPVGFHFYAIWERVSAYGITEQRYLIMLSAMWFAIMALGNVRGKIPIKAIPMTLAMLFVFASFGPWGGVSLSGLSQFSRLEKLLEKHNILQDGKIVKAEGDIPFDDRLSISSIMDYLCRSERDELLESWFNEAETKNWSCYSGTLTKKMGFDHVTRYNANLQSDERFYLNPSRKSQMDISSYDMLIKSLYFRIPKDRIWNQAWDTDDGHDVKIEYEGELLKVFIDDLKHITINIDNYLADKVGLETNDQTLFVRDENEDFAFQLYFHSISGKIEDGKPIAENMSFDFLYRIKE